MNTAVIFHWMGSDGKRFQGEGATRDMSVDGVYVLTSTCPPPNVVVQLEVILPLQGEPVPQLSISLIESHWTAIQLLRVLLAVS